MDNKSFFKEIRKIIKEEIEIALNKKNKIVEEVDFNNQIKEFQKMQSTVEGKKTPVTISELLKETKNEMNNSHANTREDNHGWKSMNFTSNDARGFNSGKTHNSTLSSFGFVENNNHIENVGVIKALTRDYSQLMKAIKDKKNKK